MEPDHEVTGASRTPGRTVPEIPGGPIDAMRGQYRAGTRKPMTSQELHRQSLVRRRDPLEDALGKDTIRMKQATAACGADPDWQRGDVGSLHGLGVPETPPRKTGTTGLTTAIPGINHVSA